MAIADNALFGIESLDDLQTQEVPPGDEELILSFKESALDRPILRKCIKEKGTMEEMMPRSAFRRIFRAVMQKKGHICGNSVHAVRRYLKKKIDGKSRFSRLFLTSAFVRPTVFTPAN